MDGLLCPECGCPEVVIYDDGTCECQGCGFVGSIDMFLSYSPNVKSEPWLPSPS